jgi:hypothetical protein
VENIMSKENFEITPEDLEYKFESELYKIMQMLLRAEKLLHLGGIASTADTAGKMELDDVVHMTGFEYKEIALHVCEAAKSLRRILENN